MLGELSGRKENLVNQFVELGELLHTSNLSNEIKVIVYTSIKNFYDNEPVSFKIKKVFLSQIT